MKDSTTLKPWRKVSHSHLLGIALAILVAAVIWSNPKQSWFPFQAPDETEAYYTAISLAEGNGGMIEINGQIHPPRYPIALARFFLAPWIKLGFAPHWMFLTPMLACVALILFTYTLGLQWGTGSGFALAATAAAIILFSIPGVAGTAERLTSRGISSVLLLCSAILLLTSGRCHAKRSAALLIPCGVCLGLAFCLRASNFLLFLPVAGVLLTRIRFGFRRFVSDGFASALPSIPLIAWALWENQQLFGSPVRTGYGYWVSLPCDFFGACFEFSQGHLSNAVRKYGFPFGVETLTFAVTLLVWSFAGIGVTGGLLGKLGGWRGREASIYTIIAALSFTLFFFPFRFFVPAFYTPIHSCVLAAAAAGSALVWRMMGSGSPFPPKATQIAIITIVGLAVGATLKRAALGDVGDPRTLRGLTYRQLNTTLPRDCVVVGGKHTDPLCFASEVASTEGRRILIPWDRTSEYASKVFNRHPPSKDARPPVDAGLRDHRLAIAWGGEEVFPFTFTEEPEKTYSLAQNIHLIFTGISEETIREKFPQVGGLKPLNVPIDTFIATATNPQLNKQLPPSIQNE